VYQNLLHSDGFLEKNNNQTAIDHAKITWFWAMKKNQVWRKIFRRSPDFTVFWRTLENTWNFWWNRRLIIVYVKIRPM
jgi:hypothetical protein